MNGPEVIMLDSDEEDILCDPKASASGTVDIVNSKPLDLQSLGIGLPSRIIPSDPVTSSFIVNRRRDGMSANKIKSKTSVGYTQQILPLPIKDLDVIQIDDDNDQNISTSNLPPSASRDECAPFTSVQPAQLLQTDILARIQNIASPQRVNKYNFECYPSTMNQDNLQHTTVNMKFKCTYRNDCNRIICGGAAFMNHIWAHVTQWKASPDNIDDLISDFNQPLLHGVLRTDAKVPPRTDVELISQCSQCLARFHTPHAMQGHYTRAHSRLQLRLHKNTCSICERDVGISPLSLRDHLVHHPVGDAPYSCGVCSYKCTVRFHLIDHFLKNHCNSGNLLCPFCTQTFGVPSYRQRKQGNVIEMKDYVAHLTAHELDERVSCSLCACTFSKYADLDRHIKEHKVAPPPNWKKVFRDPETSSRKKSAIKLFRQEKPQCTSCKSSNNGKKKKDKCYECVLLYIDRKKPSGSSFTTESDENTFLYKCSCGFSTKNIRLTIYHIIRHDHSLEEVLLGNSNEGAKTASYSQQEDEDEARIFSVRPHFSLSEVEADEREKTKGVITDSEDPYLAKRVAKFASSSSELPSALHLFRRSEETKSLDEEYALFKKLIMNRKRISNDVNDSVLKRMRYESDEVDDEIEGN